MDLTDGFREEAELIWEIENFHMHPQRPGEAIESPLLAMGEPRHSIFCLKVYPRGTSEDSEHIVTADLVRLKGSFSCQLFCKISIVTPNGKFMEGQMSTNCRSILWIKKGGLKHFGLCLPKDTLTLRCRLTLQSLPPNYAADIMELSQSISSLYESKAHSDLTLYTDDKEFMVHKVILRQRAPNFLKDLDLKNDNVGNERVEVCGISTPVLETLIHYFYNGKLGYLPPRRFPELLKIAERYCINTPDFVELTREVVDLGIPITIYTHVKVARKGINWLFPEESKIMGVDNCMTWHIYYGHLPVLVQFHLLSEPRKGLCGNISFQCHSYLDKEIFISCQMYLGYKDEQDLTSVEYHKLQFSAGEDEQEQYMPKYYFHRGYLDKGPYLRLQLNVSVSDCEEIRSVNSLNRVYSDQPSQFGLNALQYDMISLFNSTQTDNSGDVSLVFENKVISAHKAVLAAWSPVFDGMFNCDMKEKQNAKVNVPDVDHSTALRLIRFMYCGTVFKQTFTEDAKLYVVADKYQVSSLFRKCSSFLAADITLSNVCDILTMAYMHCDDSLMDSTKEFYYSNRDSIRSSSEWKLLSDTNPNLCFSFL